MSQDRPLPQAVELEEAVLGALLNDAQVEACMRVANDILKPEMFYRPEFEVIFRAIQAMYTDGQKIDIATVTDYLHVRKQLESAGGAITVSVCSSCRYATPQNIEFHARVVLQKWVLRQGIYHGQLIANRCYNEDPDIFDVFDDARDFILIEDQITKGASDIQAVSTIINEEIEDYDATAAARHSNKLTGIPTGYYQLDRETNGWQNATLTYLGARPSMGKTAFIMGSAVHAAKSGFPVAVFSLETKRIKLLKRILSAEAQVDNYRYKRGELMPDEINVLNEARSTLMDLPLYIDDEPILSITQLRSKTRRMYERHGVRMVIVDFLQLMQGKKDERKQANREQEISTISRGLKTLCMELNIPVIALSQMGREVEKRGGDKRPKLSDLRESGSLEQDADMVLLIHRPEYYGDNQDSDGNSTAGKAEIIIAKNKDGELQTLDMEFIGKYTKFVDRSSNQFGGLVPNNEFLNTPSPF